MGVDLNWTDMPASKLDEKLDAALTFSQGVPGAEYPVDPSNLSEWTDTKESLVQAFPKGKEPEDLTILRLLFFGGIPSALNPMRAFSDVQRTVKEIAQNYVNGHEYSYGVDKNARSAIHFRVLGVYNFNGSPLIALAYDADNSRKLHKTDKFINARVKAGAREIARINCTLAEQALLKRVLHFNSKRVAKSYLPPLAPEEDRYALSIFLPLEELKQEQLGVLMANDGCHMCWGPANPGRYCKTCNAVKYCGRSCHRAHQKVHKHFDERMKGGTWTDATFNFDPALDGGRMLADSPDRVNDIGASRQPSLSPPNLHGDNATLIKIQRPPSAPINDTDSEISEDDDLRLLIHDRFRTFKGYVSKKDNLEFWEAAIKLLPEPGLKNEAGVYRFAKRTGDWRLSACLDREPLGGPMW
ncbi:unnamed protein product [Peniophora sp. CBMAI 1063]|nr:unnamed protein product [Peniophora sp. CBMAI 1063]